MFDLLVKAYGADPRIRDNHGKTPRQYMVAAVAAAEQAGVGLSLSSDTFRQLKDRRRNRRQASEKNPGILRFGSLSVRVKKTTEAFNNYFGSERKHSWGSNSNQEGGGGRGFSSGMDGDHGRKHSWGPSSSSSLSAADGGSGGGGGGLVISSPIPIAGAGPNMAGKRVIDLDSQRMPPPPRPLPPQQPQPSQSKPAPLKKRKSSKRDHGSAARAKSAPTTPTKEEPAGEFRWVT